MLKFMQLKNKEQIVKIKEMYSTNPYKLTYTAKLLM